MFYFVLFYRVAAAVTGALSVIKEAFDNDVTPYFAMIICLWGKLNANLNILDIFIRYIGVH